MKDAQLWEPHNGPGDLRISWTEVLSETPKSSFPQPRATQSQQEAEEIESGSLLRGFFFPRAPCFVGLPAFRMLSEKEDGAGSEH